MERESHSEGKSLEVRYFDLVERIENGTATNLHTLAACRREPGSEPFRQSAQVE